MNVKIYSHNFAESILSQEPFKGTYDELLSICKNTPLPIYKNKSNAQKKLDVIQQLMDSYLNLQLKVKGWTSDGHFKINNTEYITIDYKKSVSDRKSEYNLHLEVEFGNVASSYRNYFKVQFLHNKNASDIGILILPTESLAKRIDSGVANFEKAVAEITSASELFSLPVLVIGLDDSNTDELALINSDLTLKQLQSKANTKHELLIIDYIKKIENMN
ncbi:BglII/BstYI family type II restriction endonuclease [Aquibacillus saliphilus]|uniref:BglII/BstYI family type II restriction endonuclease n=1 Tax=Aquibacillus saliphilus TaxID=1909422 RepID=UPI001CF019D7|nr:BglII/BstYI family type II restriction endonuclease [Aquibacillus saliphilus]